MRIQKLKVRLRRHNPIYPLSETVALVLKQHVFDRDIISADLIDQLIALHLQYPRIVRSLHN